MTPVRRRLAAALASASALALAACGNAVSAPESAPAVVRPAAVTKAANCKDGLPPVASFAPGSITSDPASVKQSPTMARIKKVGRLTVGTSGDVLLWGARNPDTGQLEGYDIDLLKAIAAKLDVPIAYKVINYGQRLPSLEKASVDLVAHTMTINCARWQGSDGQPNAINFSSEYYPAGQKVLVRADSRAKRVEDLKGQKVCVPAASTNVDNVAKMGLDLVELDVVGDCLVMFQEGEVVGITGDDTVLAGFAAQDPYARVIGDPFSAEPYGLGVSAGDPAFTRFVNAVLEEMRSDGSLQRLYDKWMADAVTGAAPAIPQPVYGRDVDRLGRPKS